MRKTLGAVIFLAAFCGRAAAMHPLISEDTAFLGTDVRQAEIGFEHTEDKGGADVYSNALSAEFSYGFMDDIDLLISAPWQGWSSQGLSESGLGDVRLEVKFAAGRAGDWTIAMKPGMSLPAGDEAKSLGAGKGGFWFYSIPGRRAGPWQFYLNGGYMYNRNSLDEERDILKASGAVLLEVFPKAMLSADLAIETNTDKAAVSHPVSSVFGAIWSPHDYLDLDIGVRLGLNKPADDIALLAGFTLRI